MQLGIVRFHGWEGHHPLVKSGQMRKTVQNVCRNAIEPPALEMTQSWKESAVSNSDLAAAEETAAIFLEDLLEVSKIAWNIPARCNQSVTQSLLNALAFFFGQVFWVAEQCTMRAHSDVHRRSTRLRHRLRRHTTPE